MTEKVNLREFGPEPDDVVRFQSDSVKEEINKGISARYFDSVSTEYLLDNDLSRSHTFKLFMIKNFAKNKRLRREYIRNLYYDTLNRAYYQLSPTDMDHDFITLQAREQVFDDAVDMKEFNPMKSAIQFIEDPTMKNPYGKREQERFNWLDFDEDIRADFLYFVGTADLFFNHDRVKKIMLLLDKLGISFTISRDEQYSGHLARILGRPRSADNLKEANKEMILKSRLKHIIVADPEEYFELKNDLYHSDLSIWHISELLLNKIYSLNSKQLHKTRMTVTFYDSLYLPSRFYKIQRKILANIGCTVVEPRHSRDHAISCGAEGGFYLNFKDDALRMANLVMEEAREAGAEAVVTDSPGAYSILKKARRKFKNTIKIYDLIDLVADSVKWTTG